MHFKTKHELSTLFVLAEQSIDKDGKRGFFGANKGQQAFDMMLTQLDRTIQIALQKGDLKEANFPAIIKLIEEGTLHARIRDDASHVLVVKTRPEPELKTLLP